MPQNHNENAVGVETKSLCEFEIKDEAKGEIQSVIATLGVTDRDKDIIRPGAIADGSKVKLSGYGHDAMFGEAPVGKGTVTAVGDKMVFKGSYFMDTTRGREAFALMKAMGTDQEWSFGFRVLGSEVPDEKEMAKGARRILTKLDAFEVSPVIVGAGIGTTTLSAKEKVEEKVEEPAPAPLAAAPSREDVALMLRVARVKQFLPKR